MSSRRLDLLLNSSITWLKKARFSVFCVSSIKYFRATASDLSKLISRPSVKRFLYTSAKGVQCIFGCKHYNDWSFLKLYFILSSSVAFCKFFSLSKTFFSFIYDIKLFRKVLIFCSSTSFLALSFLSKSASVFDQICCCNFQSAVINDWYVSIS